MTQLLQIFLFVSLLSHFWHSFFRLHLLYQPYLGLCQATCVQSHQRQPRSAVAIATCEVQVSAADSQTGPIVATGVSKPLCCRLSLTFTQTSGIYTTLLFYWSIYNYAAHAADILTPTTVVQGVDHHSWGLYCRRCYCICVCWGRSSRIFPFSRWLGQPYQGWESTHRLHLYPLGGVFYSPKHRALGRRDLDFTSHPKDDGEPWERFSESRPNSLAGVVFKNQVLSSGHCYSDIGTWA